MKKFVAVCAAILLGVLAAHLSYNRMVDIIMSSMQISVQGSEVLCEIGGQVYVHNID